MGGPPWLRGVYGWGEIAGLASFDPSDEKFGIMVRCRRKFQQPLLASTIAKVVALQQMLIIRAPLGTNFPLSPQEKAGLVDLLPPDDRPRL